MLTEAAIKIKAKQSGLVRMASPFAFIKMSQKRFARHAS